MARVMADAHAQVVPTTLVDDADMHAWIGKQDITARLIRAIVAACKAVPALNAWFDGENLTRTLHPHVDIGIAVDTDDGLFVPALRNADMLDAHGVRAAIKRLRDAGRGPQHPAVGTVRLHDHRCPTSACSPAATRRRWWCRRASRSSPPASCATTWSR